MLISNNCISHHGEIDRKDHGRIILNSVENGPLIWPTVELENGTVRPKTYEELSDKEKLQADCDLKATKIVLQGLPPDLYSFVNHHKVAKEIRDRVKLLMQGTSLSKQERLAVPTFLPSDDPIAFMNKAMAFYSTVFSPRSQGNALGLRGNTLGQTKVVKCYNCQGEGHMARQCTQQKRRRDATWFKDKVFLVQEQAEGKELDEERLAFLADPGVADGQVAQTITHNAAF
ncbi:integrase, catalytic region, zinc finger, CCHC-type containing protein [Tanacetum coccineum]